MDCDRDRTVFQINWGFSYLRIVWTVPVDNVVIFAFLGVDVAFVATVGNNFMVYLCC